MPNKSLTILIKNLSDVAKYKIYFPIDCLRVLCSILLETRVLIFLMNIALNRPDPLSKMNSAGEEGYVNINSSNSRLFIAKLDTIIKICTNPTMELFVEVAEF